MISLSVVVPVYNVEQYLDECLSSLLRQGVDDLEVIVVNDGSPDNSQQIIDRYTGAYPNIFKCVTQRNQGLGAARNTGIPYCTKEYMAFLDSDDFLIDNGYSTVIRKMQQDGADIGVFDEVWFYPDKSTKPCPTVPSFIPEFNHNTYILCHNSACNKIFRSRLWQDNDIRFPVGLWYEDLAVIPAFAGLTSKICFYAEPIYMYRQRDNSITSKAAYSEKCMDIIPACLNLHSLLENRGFESELEYLMAYQLCYYSSFRFLPFNRFAEIRKCVETLNGLYPNWQQNPYYLKKPGLFRLYCGLLSGGHYRCAKLLNSVKSRLSRGR